MIYKRTWIFVLLASLRLGLSAQFQAASWPLLSHKLLLKITPAGVERDSLQFGNSGGLANASISDNAGNLLAYSFGLTLQNSTGDTIQGGGCCLGQSVDMPSLWYYGVGSVHLQGTIILPRLGYLNQYYLFLKDMETLPDGQPTRITATLFDMSLNNGRGKVLSRAIPICNGNTLSGSRMTACKHANGRDWWLVNHEYLTNKIITHLVTPDSIYGPYSQNIGGAGIEIDEDGWDVFSQDGEKFATVTAGMTYYDNHFSLLDFDRCTGLFSNYVSVAAVNDSDHYFSFLAFSPNNRFLYAGSNHYIYQYDLLDSNISSSASQLVHDSIGQPLLGMMTLMPDNRIHVAGWTGPSEYLSVIDSPDLKFPTCAFHLRSLYVSNSVAIHNAPNFPNYNLGPSVGSSCDTLAGLTSDFGMMKEKIMSVFPNPTKDFLTIDYGFAAWNKGELYLEISNELGQLIYQQHLPMFSGFQNLDVTQFALGLYSAYIKCNNVIVATAKFFKE